MRVTPAGRLDPAFTPIRSRQPVSAAATGRVLVAGAAYDADVDPRTNEGNPHPLLVRLQG